MISGLRLLQERWVPGILDWFLAIGGLVHALRSLAQALLVQVFDLVVSELVDLLSRNRGVTPASQITARFGAFQFLKAELQQGPVRRSSSQKVQQELVSL